MLIIARSLRKMQTKTPGTLAFSSEVDTGSREENDANEIRAFGSSTEPML